MYAHTMTLEELEARIDDLEVYVDYLRSGLAFERPELNPRALDAAERALSVLWEAHYDLTHAT